VIGTGDLGAAVPSPERGEGGAKRRVSGLSFVIPAQAGIQTESPYELDPGLRRGDVSFCLERNSQ
jgi:hypothetical protein